MQDWWWEKGILNNGHEDQFTNLVNFTDGIDFDGHDFEPQRYPDDPDNGKPSFDDDSDTLLEALIMKSEDKLRAIGWVHNRTYYWGNRYQTDVCLGNLTQPQTNQPIQDVDNNTVSSDDDFLYFVPQNLIGKTFKIVGLKNHIPFIDENEYVIEWYNTTSGSLFFSQSQLFPAFNVFTGQVELTIIAPNMGNGNPHDWAFKLYHVDEGSFKMAGNTKSDSNVTEEEDPQMKVEPQEFFTIYPNPSTTGYFWVQSLQQSYLTVHDVLGRKVLEQQISSDLTQIDLSQQPKGYYLVKLSSPESYKVFKVSHQ